MMGLDTHSSLVAEWLSRVPTETAGQRVAEMMGGHFEKDRTGLLVSATDAVLERTAVHEAAHCAVATRLELRVGVARLRGAGGYVEYAAAQTDDIDGVLRVAITDLAGPCSELLIGVDRSRQSVLARSFDLLKARLAIDKCAAGGCAVSMKVVATMGCTAVRTHWAAISRVSRALAALGSLSSAEIEALCAGAGAAQ